MEKKSTIVAMYTKYKNFISQYVSLNVLEWQLCKSKLKVIKYQKGEIIHYAGDICKQLYFINSGIVRAYLIDDNGKDYTWSIFFNDDNAEMTNVFVVDYDSFINQSESHLSFEVLEACELLCIDYEEIQSLYKYFKKGEQLGRIMAELAYSHVHKLTINRLTKTARERFELFVKETPYLLDKVPQYHIASYLAITPQSLSRLKKTYKNQN